MKIRKTFQGTVPPNKILDGHSSSNTDTYSCNYINKILEAKSNYIEGRVYTDQSIAKETVATVKFKPMNQIGTGLSLTDGVIEVLDDNIQTLTINSGFQNNTWTSGALNMYIMINGENRAVNVETNTLNGLVNATLPVRKGDKVEVKAYGDVAIKIVNSPWCYLNVKAG